jgi:GTP-binding protein
MRYAHQGGMNPPLIVIHGNSLEHVTDSYKRYLEGRFREHFKLVGTPLRIEMRSSHNPFDEGPEAEAIRRLSGVKPAAGARVIT